MSRFITVCSIFAIRCLFSISAQAQQVELPMPGIIVNTRCTINDSYDFGMYWRRPEPSIVPVWAGQTWFPPAAYYSNGRAGKRSDEIGLL